MGRYLFDQYTLLHAATGVVAYFFAVPLRWWVLGHTAFELSENTHAGMRLINALPVWPGGKPRADTWTNMLGDTLGAVLGWYVAAVVDSTGEQRHWYP